MVQLSVSVCETDRDQHQGGSEFHTGQSQRRPQSGSQECHTHQHPLQASRKQYQRQVDHQLQRLPAMDFITQRSKETSGCFQSKLLYIFSTIKVLKK